MAATVRNVPRNSKREEGYEPRPRATCGQTWTGCAQPATADGTSLLSMKCSGFRPKQRRICRTAHGLAAAIFLTGAACAQVSSVAAELTDVSSALFAGSGQCAFCHDRWGRGLTGQGGVDVSIAADWRGTMMAHSFKDPLWRAVMESEVAARPKLKGYIENKCQTCHAPMAHTQARHDGSQELSVVAARKMPLAADGVSCTLCHQIQPTNLGQPGSFTGHFEIGTQREIFGPYDDVFPRPMQHHVNYTPRLGRHIQASTLCATCHTLFTPILNTDGRLTGQFPEQTPYLEWTNSVHAARGIQCQDCHMPRLDEPIRISSRPPWIDPREPFWRHQFVGGNAFMLALMRENARALKPNADTVHFDPMIQEARRQLGRAANITLRGRRADDRLTLAVRVENRTGHKFPTGHPYRRAWLHVLVQDSARRTVFESGAPTADGRIRGSNGRDAAHLDEITRPEQVQIYEAVMGDAGGQSTRSLLGAVVYLKDNRIPPSGFVAKAAPDSTAIHGVSSSDVNFNAGPGGEDTVTYQVVLPPAAGKILVEVRLLYQAVPPDAVEPLQRSRGSAAREFTRLYRDANKTPEVVSRAHAEL